MTIYLERVTVRLPDTDAEFSNDLASLIGALGQKEGRLLRLARSSPSFYPEIVVDLQPECPGVLAEFDLSSGEAISVQVGNSTGMNKPSRHSCRPISVETARRRLEVSGIRLAGADHVGFNLPWFSPGLHPRILQLREELSARCLYHRYPTGEPWDFIIPGDVDEIAGRKAVDYTAVRRPKFEIVSFDGASTPLIQFDLGASAGYEGLARLFPESLNDPEFRNVWVYLKTPYAVDLCLVLNELSKDDWSGFFQGCRL